VQIVERDHREHTVRRQTVELHFDVRHQREGSLGPGEELRRVRGVRAQVLELVAAAASREGRERRAEQRRRALRDVRQLVPEIRREAVERSVQVGRTSVRQDDVESMDVVDRRAVDDRMGAARVGRGHTADRALPLGRGIRAEVEVDLRRLFVERPPSGARLDARDLRLCIDALDHIEQRAVDLQPFADALSREGRSGSARGYRYADLAAHVDRRMQVVGVLGAKDRDGKDPVRGGVRRVELARNPVHAHRSDRLALERPRDISRRSHACSMPGLCRSVIVTLLLTLAACRTTEPVAPAFPKPTPQGPSQTRAEAKRDGVPAKVGAMTISDRLEVASVDSPSITTDEGVWTLARPRIGTEYGEVLLLDARREKVIKAFPLSWPPYELAITDEAVYCGRSGDGGLPNTTICRIDRRTKEVTGRAFLCTDCADPPRSPPRREGWSVTYRSVSIYDFVASVTGVWLQDFAGTWTRLDPKTLEVRETNVEEPRPAPS
jgi:hypothetical protein